jgi:glycine/D-amino acid oxidase-like deaminating enzyme
MEAAAPRVGVVGGGVIGVSLALRLAQQGAAVTVSCTLHNAASTTTTCTA